MGDDPEFVAELIDDFLADAPIQLESLREAASRATQPRARRAAHTLKGNSRTFGAGELASLCQEAETAAGRGRSRCGAVPRSTRSTTSGRRVRAELVAFRDGRGRCTRHRDADDGDAASPELVEARRRLAELESLVENSPVAVIVMDTDERVTDWNPAAAALFGYSAEEALGRPDRRPRVRRHGSRRGARGHTRGDDHRSCTADRPAQAKGRHARSTSS